MTLRELLEREKERYIQEEGYLGMSDRAKGFSHALELLMPVVLETQDFVDDHEWAISLREALSELRTKLGDK